MANKGKRMLFEEDYEYLQDLVENHPDPSAEWGGGDEISAGTGITITTESDDTKTISVDTESVAMKTDIPSYTAGYGINIGSDDAISVKTDVVATLGNNNTFTKTNTFTSALQVLKRNPGISLASNVYDDKYAQIIYQDSDITQSSLRLSTSSNNTTRLYSGVAGVEIVSGGQTYTFDTTSGGTVAVTSDITEVAANTGATPSYVLSDIQVGQDVYSIPTGTTVVANSTATPSATLTTLQVGSDTYEIPQGGGSSYTFTNGLTESSGTVGLDLKTQASFGSNYNSNLTGQIGFANMGFNILSHNTYQNRQQYITLHSDAGINIEDGYGPIGTALNNKTALNIVTGSSTGYDWEFRVNRYIDNSWTYAGLVANNNTLRYGVLNSRSTSDYTIVLEASKTKFEYLGKAVPSATAPTTDGTYVLEATVASGVVTYNWVLKQ